MKNTKLYKFLFEEEEKVDAEEEIYTPTGKPGLPEPMSDKEMSDFLDSQVVTETSLFEELGIGRRKIVYEMETPPERIVIGDPDAEETSDKVSEDIGE